MPYPDFMFVRVDQIYVSAVNELPADKHRLHGKTRTKSHQHAIISGLWVPTLLNAIEHKHDCWRRHVTEFTQHIARVIQSMFVQAKPRLNIVKYLAAAGVDAPKTHILASQIVSR